MWTTLKATSWSGLETFVQATGVTVKAGTAVGFDTRDIDTGVVVRKPDGKTETTWFWLKSPTAGVPTVKKIEVLNAAGTVIDTQIGEPMIEEPKPKAKPKPRSRASKAKS